MAVTPKITFKTQLINSRMGNTKSHVQLESTTAEWPLLKEATGKETGLHAASSTSTMALGVAGKPTKSHSHRFNNQNKRLGPKDYSGFTRLLQSQSRAFCLLL